MQKIYSLLRNNKQTGPYSLEELIQDELKPFDLIWVQGSSGGWSYPSEINSLKAYVPSTPGEKSIAPVASTEASSSTSNIDSIHSLNTPSTVAANVSPALPKHIFISLPAGANFSSGLGGETSSNEQIVTEESPEAALERKAIELRNKIQAFEKNKNAPKADDDIDTKYSRSLDDIKDEYTTWLHQKKTAKVFRYKQHLTVAASIAGVLLLSYFLFNYGNASRPATTQPIVTQVKTVSADAAFAPETNYTSEESIGTKIKKPVKSPILKKSLPVVKIKDDQEDRVENFVDSLEAVNNKIASDPAKEPVTNDPPIQSSETNTKGERISTRREPTKPTVIPARQNDATSTPISQLIKLSESTDGSKSFLTIYNNSKHYVNFVAVDVVFKKANNKSPQKKTIYFNNIAPGTFLKLPAPDHQKAESREYVLGLISTEGGLYYAKQ